MHTGLAWHSNAVRGVDRGIIREFILFFLRLISQRFVLDVGKLVVGQDLDHTCVQTVFQSTVEFHFRFLVIFILLEPVALWRPKRTFEVNGNELSGNSSLELGHRNEADLVWSLEIVARDSVGLLPV